MQNDELMDVVDLNDNVIRQEWRSNIYKGLKPSESYRVVNILIFNSKEELLLPLRSGNRRIFPNCYDFSCGEHVMAGEDYDAAAVRGLKEELDISNMPVELGKLSPKSGVSSFMKIYKLEFNKIPEKYDHNGISEIKFFKVDNVLKMIKDNPNNFKGDFLPVLKWYLGLKHIEK